MSWGACCMNAGLQRTHRSMAMVTFPSIFTECVSIHLYSLCPWYNSWLLSVSELWFCGCHLSEGEYVKYNMLYYVYSLFESQTLAQPCFPKSQQHLLGSYKSEVGSSLSGSIVACLAFLGAAKRVWIGSRVFVHWDESRPLHAHISLDAKCAHKRAQISTWADTHTHTRTQKGIYNYFRF